MDSNILEDSPIHPLPKGRGLLGQNDKNLTREESHEVVRKEIRIKQLKDIVDNAHDKDRLDILRKLLGEIFSFDVSDEEDVIKEEIIKYIKKCNSSDFHDFMDACRDIHNDNMNKLGK